MSKFSKQAPLFTYFKNLSRFLPLLSNAFFISSFFNLFIGSQAGITKADNYIEEILVTSQKRQENILEVPIAITAYQGDTLNALGARTLSDIGRYTSGVETLNSDGSQPTYNIRGIETFDFTAGSDSTVAVYVDGVHIGRDAGSEVPLTDIDRVEILKGPQGTLWGRNSIGGLIHIVTPKPDATQAGNLKLSLGNYDREDIAFAFTQPVSETLSLRFSAASQRRDGWLDNLVGPDLNQQDNQDYRLTLAWSPRSDLDIIWRTSYQERDQMSGVIPGLTQAIYDQAGTLSRGAVSVFDRVALDGRSLEERDIFGSSLTVVKEWDRVTLTSITAWRSFNADFLQDEDGTDHPDYVFNSLNRTDDDQFSQELRLNGETARSRWTLGVSYSREHIDRTTQVEFSRSTLETFAGWEALKNGQVPGLPSAATLAESQLAELLPGVRAFNRFNGVDGIFLSSFFFQLTGPPPICGTAMLTPTQCINTVILPGVQAEIGSGTPWLETLRNTGTFESMALFGDISWALTDKLNLSVGGRYTRDDKTFTIQTRYENSFLGMPFGLAFFNNGNPILDQRLSDDWSDFSGRIVLDYQLTDTVLGYASVSSGFKSGGFNSLNFGPGVTPVYDSEKLINYELGMKGRLFENRVQFSLAAYFYQYSDLQELDLVGVPIPSYNLRNADAEGSGFDFDIIYAVTNHLTFSGNYSYLDTQYTDYEIIPAVGETAADDRTGQRRASTPRNKFNATLSYVVPIATGGILSFRTDYSYTGARLSTGSLADQRDPGKRVGSYDIVNARLSYSSSAENWQIALWGMNLEDDDAIADFGNIGQAIGSITAWPLPPRTYGVDITYSF